MPPRRGASGRGRGVYVTAPRGRGRGGSVGLRGTVLRRSGRHQTQIAQPDPDPAAADDGPEENNEEVNEPDAPNAASGDEQHGADEPAHGELTSTPSRGSAQSLGKRRSTSLLSSFPKQRKVTTTPDEVRAKLVSQVEKTERRHQQAAARLQHYMDDVNDEKASAARSTTTSTSSSSPPLSTLTTIPPSSSPSPASTLIRDIKKSVKGMTWQPMSKSGPDTIRIRTFLKLFEAKVRSEGGTEEHLMKLIGLHLSGQAFEWFSLLAKDSPVLRSWDSFKERIIKEYQPKLPFSTVNQRLKDCKKLPQEDYNAHFLRFTHILEDFEPNSLLHDALVDTYLGTLNPEVALAVTNTLRIMDGAKSAGLGEISAWAASADQDLNNYRVTDHYRASTPKTQAAHAASSTPTIPTITVSTVGTQIPGVSSNYKGKKPDPNYRHKNSQQAGQPPAQGGPVKPPIAPTFPALPPGGVKIESGLCFNCNQAGHIAKHCPLPRNPARPRFNSGKEREQKDQ